MRTFPILAAALLFLAGCGVFGGSDNHAPTIETIVVEPPSPQAGVAVTLRVQASDPDDDELEYQWQADAGSFQDGSSVENPAQWVSPSQNGSYEVTCIVDDGEATASHTVTIEVGRQRQ